MVRAAAAGVVDYTRADPKDINWKLRHRMLIHEMQRQEEGRMLDAVHRHWLTYVLKTNLTEESAALVKEHASDTLKAIRDVIFPWRAEDKDESQKDTIKSDEKDIIARYKQFEEELKQQQNA